MKADVIGAMRERITIVEPLEALDGYGQSVITWQEKYLNTYAAVEYIAQGSNEEFEAGKKTSFTRIKFRVRKRELTEKMRIVYRSKEYEIDSIAYTEDRCYMLVETREDDQILYSA